MLNRDTMKAFAEALRKPCVDYCCSNCGKVLTDSHHAWAPPEVLATLLCGECWLENFEHDREPKIDHNW